ncbi:hypothetical protein [uncultured Chryseobacterium sp.]|jgi:hypothetical protein|uniref:hypothetical protein n=1 Tax=uncultured Chryseobacterium sp. TaxID=259322 RepID=UPI00262FCCCB|nr:hypothetical protein [uncultured Chryseobacterium sp.]
MKKFLNILMLGASLLTVVYSCSEAEHPFYEGDSYLHFSKDESGDAYVTINSGSADYKIPYGVTKAVEGNHNVELVLDESKSTAVLGTDFTVEQGVLPSGATTGEITINVKEAAAAANKKAVFKLKSATLPIANFKTEYTVTFNLRCPISSFAGNFELTNSFFWDAGDVFQVIEDPTTPNQLRIVGFMDDGSDFVVKYNPDTYVVTFDTQSTGYIHPTYNAAILIRPATNSALVSSFNPCTRKLTIYMDYWMNGVGGWTNQNEAFSGI